MSTNHTHTTSIATLDLDDYKGGYELTASAFDDLVMVLSIASKQEYQYQTQALLHVAQSACENWAEFATHKASEIDSYLQGTPYHQANNGGKA